MRLICTSLLALFSLGLSACATPGAAQPQASAVTAECATVDCQKMAAIDRAARARGLTVVWVHPPQKKAAETSTQ